MEHIRKNEEYLAKIDRGIAQKNAGTMKEHDLIDPFYSETNQSILARSVKQLKDGHGKEHDSVSFA